MPALGSAQREKPVSGYFCPLPLYTNGRNYLVTNLRNTYSNLFLYLLIHWIILPALFKTQPKTIQQRNFINQDLTSHIPHLENRTYQISHIRNIKHPLHSTSETSHIPKRIPRIQKIHIPNIQHAKHPTSWISYIPNVPHPGHSKSGISQTLLPNIPHLEHFISQTYLKNSRSQTSQIAKIRHPKQIVYYTFNTIVIWLVQRNSNLIVSFIEFSNTCKFLKVPSTIFEFNSSGQHLIPCAC